MYFDNAATTQKPQSVIDAVSHYYSHYNANVHRGIHSLSEEGTLAMEASRQKVTAFINAESWREVIFTKGTTESINLVANSLGESYFNKGDEIVISTMEHHANIVPWQLLAKRKGLVLKVARIFDNGELDIEHFKSIITDKTKLISIVHTSNALGTRNPVEDLCKLANNKNIPILLDTAQAVAHEKIDVQLLNCDFLVFSSHKLFGPTGVGILYGKQEWLDKMEPYQAGGEMIDQVSFEGSTWNALPFKFEAGTPNIAGNIALKNAIEFVESIGFEHIAKHEQELLNYATEALLGVDGLTIYGQSSKKAGIISFAVKGVHHQDLALMLDAHGIAVRTGHHCTQPLMQRFGISGTSRVSFSVYNTIEEIEFFVQKLKSTIKLLG